jgi:hypothetical protein
MVLLLDVGCWSMKIVTFLTFYFQNNKITSAIEKKILTLPIWKKNLFLFNYKKNSFDLL